MKIFNRMKQWWSAARHESRGGKVTVTESRRQVEVKPKAMVKMDPFRSRGAWARARKHAADTWGVDSIQYRDIWRAGFCRHGKHKGRTVGAFGPARRDW